MIECLAAWISAGESAAAIVKAVWPPHAWTNVEVRFGVSDVKMGFRCDDKAMGKFRVWVVDSNMEEIAYLEGNNEDDATPTTGFDLRSFTSEFLKAIFNMARCRRELERTGEIKMAKDFAKYRQKVVDTFSDQPVPGSRPQVKVDNAVSQ
jgi:hypothetical protein